jgi:lipid-binding SYLF domain-containing protein
MGRFTRIAAALTVSALILGGCSGSPEPKSEAAKHSMTREVDAALTKLQEADPGLEAFLENAHGYAIFPSVGKGGAVVGGAYGKGEVYEQGNLIGYASLTQASIGAQLGGQTFSEIIAFETPAALERFKEGNYTPAANASAVALKAGAAAGTTFKDGVAIFTKPEGGAMFEASIGGQKFNFEHLSDAATTRPSAP